MGIAPPVMTTPHFLNNCESSPLSAMIDLSVPFAISRWLGMGTVALSPPGRSSRMMIWLPDCRLCTKLCALRMRQTSDGGSGRSLGMLERQRPHARPALQPALDLRGARRFQPQRHCLAEHPVRLGARLALARHAEFRTVGNKPSAVLCDHRREIG